MTHRLLAINFGGIGDEILFLPVLESIRAAFPSWHINLLLEPRSKAIKEITDLIDEVKLFDIKKRPLMPGDYLQLWHILANGNYQTVISSGSSPLVSCLLFASGIKQRIGYDSGALSRFLLTTAVQLNKNQYAGNMYHDLVGGLGLECKQVIPKIKVKQSSRGQQGKAKIIIHPGTSKLALQKGIIKTWSAANWANLIGQLLGRADLEVILAGGPDDEATIEEINQALKQKRLQPEQNCLISAYGQTKSLADLAALIASADLLICVDSAPMHIAVALNKPLLAIFGPTNPAHLLPPVAHFKFLKNPSSDEVLSTAVDLLQQKTAR